MDKQEIENKVNELDGDTNLLEDKIEILEKRKKEKVDKYNKLMDILIDLPEE